MTITEVCLIAFFVVLNIIIHYKKQKNASLIFFLSGVRLGEIAGAEKMWNALYREVEHGINNKNEGRY